MGKVIYLSQYLKRLKASLEVFAHKCTSQNCNTSFKAKTKPPESNPTSIHICFKYSNALKKITDKLKRARTQVARCVDKLKRPKSISQEPATQLTDLQNLILLSSEKNNTEVNKKSQRNSNICQSLDRSKIKKFKNPQHKKQPKKKLDYRNKQLDFDLIALRFRNAKTSTCEIITDINFAEKRRNQNYF